MQPIVQLGVESRRGFAVASFALAESFDSALKLGTSLWSMLQFLNERQQLRQHVLRQFIVEQRLLATFVLKRSFTVFAIFFSASIHLDYPGGDFGLSMM